MAKIVWTENARQWLREIRDYIAEDNPGAAIRTIEGIYEKVQLLAKFPELGYRYEHPDHPGIRILLFGHYRIAYIVKKGKRVEILGVYHAAMDIDRYL